MQCVHFCLCLYMHMKEPPFTVLVAYRCVAQTFVPAVYWTWAVDCSFSGKKYCFRSEEKLTKREDKEEKTAGVKKSVEIKLRTSLLDILKWKIINDPAAICYILTKAPTSSSFILFLPFICLSIILLSLNPSSPLVSTLPPCHPAAKTFPCSFLWTLFCYCHLSYPFSEVCGSLISAPVRHAGPLAAISRCYGGKRSRLYKDQYKARKSSNRFCLNLWWIHLSLHLPALKVDASGCMHMRERERDMGWKGDGERERDTKVRDW